MNYKDWTKEKLIEYEREIGSIYENKLMRPSPIHLCEGNEDQLIQIFNRFNIDENTWVFSTWRSHYVWLLSGRDPLELKKQIVEGHSMHIFGHKFFTSAIVAGISPIALGVAKAIKMKGLSETVYCFVGCATSKCGLTLECINYASGHDLPILYIIEDNDRCVNISTKQVWGYKNTDKTLHYSFKTKFPHAGTGKYVMF
jgi:TPP-dependent pyruvate/acetoin dehydrogenase alpha subunit